MKLLIKENEKKIISLWLPSVILKNRFLLRSLMQKVNMTAEDTKQLRKSAKAAYRSLRRYVGKHDHFTLLEVFDRDGTYISIRI